VWNCNLQSAKSRGGEHRGKIGAVEYRRSVLDSFASEHLSIFSADLQISGKAAVAFSSASRPTDM
jgi:hypothetical protein